MHETSHLIQIEVLLIQHLHLLLRWCRSSLILRSVVIFVGVTEIIRAILFWLFNIMAVDCASVILLLNGVCMIKPRISASRGVLLRTLDSSVLVRSTANIIAIIGHLLHHFISSLSS